MIFWYNFCRGSRKIVEGYMSAQTASEEQRKEFYSWHDAAKQKKSRGSRFQIPILFVGGAPPQVVCEYDCFACKASQPHLCSACGCELSSAYQCSATDRPHVIDSRIDPARLLETLMRGDGALLKLVLNMYKWARVYADRKRRWDNSPPDKRHQDAFCNATLYKSSAELAGELFQDSDLTKWKGDSDETDPRQRQIQRYLKVLREEQLVCDYSLPGKRKLLAPHKYSGFTSVPSGLLSWLPFLNGAELLIVLRLSSIFSVLDPDKNTDTAPTVRSLKNIPFPPFIDRDSLSTLPIVPRRFHEALQSLQQKEVIQLIEMGSQSKRVEWFVLLDPDFRREPSERYRLSNRVPQ